MQPRQAPSSVHVTLVELEDGGHKCRHYVPQGWSRIEMGDHEDRPYNPVVG